MIRWRFFPQSTPIPEHLLQITNVFSENENLISSDTHQLVSDDVLHTLLPGLSEIGYAVEKSKQKADKINVPVLFGECGRTDLAFEVDAYSAEQKTVIEVEAGRGVVNYQFLKDFFEVCMMPSVDYFCVAVRKDYRGVKDFDKVCSFFSALYASNRLSLPLKGILIVGY